MRITVLGACGAWPTPGQACSGFLVEYEGFQLIIDLGYATVPRLLEWTSAERIDAVLISHGHPDHCADLNPLLRARALGEDPPAPLPVHALPGALDAVLALDRPETLAGSYTLSEFDGGARFRVGPFEIHVRLLPHWVPNAGMRITAGGRTVTYTGDTGPSPDVIELARNADLLIADATFVEHVPRADAPFLTSARQAGEQATAAGAGNLLLSHLWPGTDADAARESAARRFSGGVQVAQTGVRLDTG